MKNEWINRWNYEMLRFASLLIVNYFNFNICFQFPFFTALFKIILCFTFLPMESQRFVQEFASSLWIPRWIKSSASIHWELLYLQSSTRASCLWSFAWNHFVSFTFQSNRFVFVCGGPGCKHMILWWWLYNGIESLSQCLEES